MYSSTVLYLWMKYENQINWKMYGKIPRNAELDGNINMDQCEITTGMLTCMGKV